jgi:membrane-associated protein
MDLLLAAWEFIGNLDKELGLLLLNYGGWIYLILFLIIFCETGLVIAPFLPGDSLLFASGALWATADLPVELLALTLIVASFCGDNCNYWIGRLFGSRVVKKAHSRFLNRRALDRTHQFYRRHGGKTIILARFVPIVRTFAPFVAGIGQMDYRRFLTFSVVGAVLWVGLLVFCGYLFGKLPVVQDNFALVIVAIIGFSLIPVAFEYVRARLRR